MLFSVLIISFLSASKDTPDWFKALHLLQGLNNVILPESVNALWTYFAKD
jgi:hypothetical protein